MSEPVSIHAMGDHWSPDGQRRTELGDLVARAKEDGDHEAVHHLVARIGEWAAAAGWPARVVVTAVAPNPSRDDGLAAALAAGVAAAIGAECAPEAVQRRNATARLRDTDPADRPRLAAEAGYEVTADVAGRDVVIVDDVVLTGTTLRHIAGLMRAAGAASVVGLAASRTQRRPSP